MNTKTTTHIFLLRGMNISGMLRHIFNILFTNITLDWFCQVGILVNISLT